MLQNFANSPPYFCPKYVVLVKSKVEISQNYVAFSEYLNFKTETTLQVIELCHPVLVLMSSQ